MYKYENEKSKLFTEAGQVDFLKVRDNVDKLIKAAGCVTMGRAISGIPGGSWEQMACVDRLVELDEIYEVTATMKVAGQHRIFSKHNQ